jgi:hypothetical protein
LDMLSILPSAGEKQLTGRVIRVDMGLEDGHRRTSSSAIHCASRSTGSFARRAHSRLSRWRSARRAGLALGFGLGHS